MGNKHEHVSVIQSAGDHI